ncbi:hypothetical protein CBER1_11687 [Cercospora berteroae]|uniref:HTH CENPB-type domain-containing protein n=1 Tax=Cercospora berteroae TaxID=357750 RepID=A0A2S6CIL7_9PEZI|nr:hypothetical protein CBER1_11687 [Cercospora berteroae]
MSGRTSRAQGHEHEQILSSAEEKTLVRWLSRLTCAEFPASPALTIQIAEKVRQSRLWLARTPPTLPSTRRPMGKHWLDRFRNRHPEIQGVWTRQIEGVRHNIANLDIVKTYFEAVTELYLQH